MCIIFQFVLIGNVCMYHTGVVAIKIIAHLLLNVSILHWRNYILNKGESIFLEISQCPYWIYIY